MGEITFKALLNILESKTKVKIEVTLMNLELEAIHLKDWYEHEKYAGYHMKTVKNIWIQTDGTLVVTLEDAKKET